MTRGMLNFKMASGLPMKPDLAEIHFLLEVEKTEKHHFHSAADMISDHIKANARGYQNYDPRRVRCETSMENLSMHDYDPTD